MTTPLYPNQKRIEDLESSMSQVMEQLRSTAFRENVTGDNRNIHLAKTIDPVSGDYPEQTSGTVALPITFQYGDFNNALPGGPVTPAFTDFNYTATTTALAKKWVAKNTEVKVILQNRRWWIIEEGSSSVTEKVLLAYSNAQDKFNCDSSIKGTPPQYLDWGIFTLPWDEHAPSGGMDSEIQWADGTNMSWSSGEDVEWSEDDASESWDWDNPFAYCGEKGDLLLIQYVGPTRTPIIVDVIRKCVKIGHITYRPEDCRTYYEEYDACIQYSEKDGNLLWKMNPEYLVTDVYYDEKKCTVFQQKEQFCIVQPLDSEGLPPEPPQPDPVLDLRGITDPCCPCSDGCSGDCEECDEYLNFSIEGWSASDCGCMNVAQGTGTPGTPNSLQLDKVCEGIFPFRNCCQYDGELVNEDMCEFGSLGVRIGRNEACEWVIYIAYGTNSGNFNNIRANAKATIKELSACPPKGTFPLDELEGQPGKYWDYEGGPECMSEPSEVTIF